MAQAVNPYYLDNLYEMRVADAILVSNTTGVESFTSSLETAQLEQSISETEVRGGSANEIQVLLKTDKKIKVTLTDVRQNRDAFAQKLGGQLKERLATVSEFPQNYTLEEGDLENEFKITLAHEPKGKLPVFYNKKTKLALPEGTVEGKVIKIVDDGGSLAAGQVVFGSSYLYETTADGIDFKSDSVADTYRLELHIPIMNEKMQKVFTKKIVFYNSALSESFSTSLSTTVEKQTDVRELTVLAHDDYEELGFVIYEPVEA